MGRGVRRRHGQDGENGQPQNPPAPLGRRGATSCEPPSGGRAVVSKASKSREPSASESALALRRCWTRGRQAPKTVSARQARQHLLPDKFPQSTEPLDENPRPHTQLGAQLQDDFVSADERYQDRPFRQPRRPSFLGPTTEAFRRDGFAASRPPPAAPSSSVSGRLGEAALRGGEAIWRRAAASSAAAHGLEQQRRRCAHGLAANTAEVTGAVLPSPAA